MEVLINQAQDVLNNLHKNDENMAKLLDNVKLIKEKAQNFSWAKSKITQIDSECDILCFDGIDNLSSIPKPSSSHYPSHYKFSLNDNISNDNINNNDNNNNITDENEILKKELQGLRDANIKLTNENERLAIILNEQNNVLQHIMEKYRFHVTQLLQNSENDLINKASETIEKLELEIGEKNQKIIEMAQIMRAAIQLDIDASKQDIELNSQLSTENKLLRDIIDAKNVANTDLLWDDVCNIKNKNDKQLSARTSIESFISCHSNLNNSDSSNSDVSK